VAGRGEPMTEQSELERLTARRVTLIYRLELIAKGATLTYDDGTPVDMASEKARLEEEVTRLDRKIFALQPSAGQA
jgi:cell division protein FtsB